MSSGRSSRSSRSSQSRQSKSTKPSSNTTSETSNTEDSRRRSSAYDADFEQPEYCISCRPVIIPVLCSLQIVSLTSPVIPTAHCHLQLCVLQCCVRPKKDWRTDSYEVCQNRLSLPGTQPRTHPALEGFTKQLIRLGN